jgi:hypothetical protein
VLNLPALGDVLANAAITNQRLAVGSEHGRAAGRHPDRRGALGLHAKLEVAETLALLRREIKLRRRHSRVFRHDVLEKALLFHLLDGEAEQLFHTLGNELNLALERHFPKELAGNIDDVAEALFARAQLVASLLLDLVGRGKLAVVELNLRKQREIVQHRKILRAWHARLVVHHAKCTDERTVLRGDGIGHIKTYIGLARDAGTAGKAFIELRIGNHHLLVLEDGVRAERILARDLGNIDTDARLEEAAVLIDQHHAGHRHIEYPRRQSRDPVEPFLRRRIEQIQGTQRLETLGLIRGNWGGHFRQEIRLA